MNIKVNFQSAEEEARFNGKLVAINGTEGFNVIKDSNGIPLSGNDLEFLLLTLWKLEYNVFCIVCLGECPDKKESVH
ncbi:MAG TPA: hypothetical protein DCX32_03885 [Candidatus Moranbacteria bacterium]|nr:hypothetical protein [Candidatus Moranbacteria bacterium]